MMSFSFFFFSIFDNNNCRRITGAERKRAEISRTVVIDSSKIFTLLLSYWTQSESTVQTRL